LSDDFTDDCWTMSDAAYRLHTEGITWSNRKLLDCRIPKDDIRRMKRPEAIAELLADGWWREEGDEYVIVHHSSYQRLKKDVIKQQDANRANGARGGRPKKVAPVREVWQPSENPVANPVASRTAKPVDNRKGQYRTGLALEVSTTRGAPTTHPGGSSSPAVCDWCHGEGEPNGCPECGEINERGN
jgi:hypothetical protein